MKKTLAFLNDNHFLIIIFLYLISSELFIYYYLSDSSSYLFRLTENQIMYLSSTSAQVVATLFGLTITGYIFFDGKLKNDTDEDDSLVDVINWMKQNYRKKLGWIAFFSFIAIFCCMANIILGCTKINILILNNSINFSIISILLIIAFIFEVIGPNIIQNSSKAAQKEMDITENTLMSSDHLADFLKTYNEIDQMLSQAVEKLLPNQENKNNHKNNNMYQNLKTIVSKELLPMNILGELNYLRKYRNYVVHGVDVSISQKAYTQIVKLKEEIEKALSNFPLVKTPSK